jgi:hypothetical protein
MLIIAGVSVILLAMEPSIRRFGTLSEDVLGLFRARWAGFAPQLELRQLKYRRIKILLKRG